MANWVSGGRMQTVSRDPVCLKIPTYRFARQVALRLPRQY